MFDNEQSLVAAFVKNLGSSPFSEGRSVRFSTEFNYQRGKTDIIALDATDLVIAIEAKLERWRDALDQAYRNTCFAHYSYVLLPQETAALAMKSLSEFSDRSVGICIILDDAIQIIHHAKLNPPLQDWLSERATESIISGGRDDRTD